MNEELKPCPFCGSQDVESTFMGHGALAVLCYECEAEGPPADTLEESIAAWNKRND